MSPVRSDLEEIVGKKAGGGGTSPSPSAAPRKASKSFVISSEERAGPAAQPNAATPAVVEMKQVGYGSAAGGSVFKMATFAESGTEYAKVTKPVVEYK